MINIKITDASDPAVAVYSISSEAKLKHFYEPDPGLFIVESPNVVLRALKAGYQPQSLFLEERFLCPSEECMLHAPEEHFLHVPEEARTGSNDVWASIAEVLKLAGDVPIYTAELNLMSEVCGFKQSRGFMAAMKRKPLPKVEEVLAGATRVAVLEDVENPANVGAIFRSAAALGMDAVLLTYGSADPLYRRASRVSMGGAFMIPWTFVGNKYGGWPEPGLQTLKEHGFSLAGMALSDRAVLLNNSDLCREKKLAVLLGNEQNGLLPQTQASCDYLVQIPMQHQMDSLNVAAASSVVFWQLGKSIFEGQIG